MLVKELPPLVRSMSNEKGADVGKQFNQQATQTLSSLQDALTQARTGLENAQQTALGKGGADIGGDMDDMGGIPSGPEGEEGMGDLPDTGEEDMGDMPDMGEPEAPEMPQRNVGRSKRP
jgi:hypothetical protein